MQIKDLKINDEVSVKVSTQRLRDTDDEKWIYEPICETAKVVEVDKDGLFASIVFADGKWGELDKDTEWYPIPSSTKIATHDRPAHYGDSNKDLIDYWCERYSAEELKGAFKSQISKYVDRLGYKDDEIKELNKIIDYATRYKNHLEKVKA
ncbi:TPA: DUF3310 domain-containing protein [Staphylococcus pseudintermedius]|uniref:DUF3310 domain-containing protein n=1 Tax=Staphylococcus pseudintermedius TaxID=283734 RepID=UPI001A0E8A31|nr:DUF3310 domain-containing protein [Staphylococcus pseudintermedius]EGQ1601588.1 DUF3310 domain-containing protein [Staphylococcus pseudintermedius]EGQ3310839.1 DUF3310 domain-containing protein [Staphylococcus pseudintermedius]EGQ3367119.1 DUF3310 domain-containing protein [Staphylococcus pseudintermedius]EGQ4034644.1 DUF3310 domain-containing protein [Staphylococcus pseudintermedius]EGQ4075430.1 DUF3310 domain-containing protein [Staphylococcus pseudintermedius]